MITAVHIEDEPRNIDLLQSFIYENFKDVIDYKGSAQNIENAYRLIKIEKPKLVFLDIELKNGNAFELLDKIENSFGVHFQIVFITAFNEYAIKAFRANAIDFLLKPICVTELKQAVEKVYFKQKNNSFSDSDIISLLKQLTEGNASKKISIPTSNGVEFVRIDHIIKLEAKGSYTNIYLENSKKIVCTKNIGEFENSLPENLFIRVHNAWIINTQYLVKYIKGKNGYLVMEDNSIVPISIRKKGNFLENF